MSKFDSNSITDLVSSGDQWSEDIPERINLLPEAPITYDVDEPLKIDETDVLGNAKYARNILQSMAKKSQQLVELSLNRLSDEETVSSRGIEVTTGAIAQTVELAEKLIELDERIREIQGTKPDAVPQTVNYVQNNYNCTTAELLKKLKQLDDMDTPEESA